MKRPITLFLALALFGCATSGQYGLRSFNTDFKESIPTDPQYKIEVAGSNRFQIVVYQGSALISERTTRASFLTRAASLAIENHCIQRGCTLGEHSIEDRVDSLGYINALGFFTCVPKASSEIQPPR
ncbi:MAG: hypothetical protein JW884_12790 [Deltaproteobacteria bacterium]|nr:hypothetical protein [Deltaproteobacteria bacterium]